MQTKSEKYLVFKTNMDTLVKEYNDELAEKAAEILSEISDTKYDKSFIKYYINHWEDTKRVVSCRENCKITFRRYRM